MSLRRRLAVVTAALAFVGTLGIVAPAHADVISYAVCNSGNSVSDIHAYNIYWPGESRIVSPGSLNCKFMTQDEISGLRIDPEINCGSASCQVQRYRIRPGDSSTYGPWHCGEATFNPPDAWLTQGGIDVQTSNSDGTTC